MTPEQTEKILTLIQAEYPNSFTNMDDRMKALKLNLWSKEFEGDDFQLVYAAVRMFMRSGGAFAPTIGEVRQKMSVLTAPEELPEQTAWALVSKATARGGLYEPKREFDALPPDVQRAVGSPEQLKAWAMMDEQTVQSVVASNFMRAYRTQQTRKRELALLPEEMRAMLGGIAQIGDGS